VPWCEQSARLHEGESKQVLSMQALLWSALPLSHQICALVSGNSHHLLLLLLLATQLADAT
jgi:hypothetical protein